ncbi:hypothetical protein GCM10007094_23710 [Pseudovibrio japonicus]|uniref:DUF1640 domain-containing protein n=1 Tax=Pseudovibrio japonicus TaxID=366534 RepID=A0ABQ3EGK5_9HYPH|nr:hypothetical protein [Pseudovibrio japonicus]GHB33991.1 hypothetical protein GCM10007094_23710 [Pseudovibrio japonicus]
MALVFDSLSYAKDLEDKGVPRKQAEAHANAARDYIMKDLVTKEDLRLALENHANVMTIRLTGIMAAILGAFALFDKFFI